MAACFCVQELTMHSLLQGLLERLGLSICPFESTVKGCKAVAAGEQGGAQDGSDAGRRKGVVSRETKPPWRWNSTGKPSAIELLSSLIIKG